MTSPTPIAEYVMALPELYQPIYGHPELSARPSRVTDDRVKVIRRAVAALGAALERPLRILDLGSAQGYVSLSLAADGHEVTGVDNLAANVALARHLAGEFPDFRVTFLEVDIEAMLADMQPGTYDLLLGLSIFHHLVHVRGAAHVTALLAGLAPKVAAGLFELATSSEPLHWAAAQPADEQGLLSGFSFVHELARFPTHLSEWDRPLLFASNRYWYFGKAMEAFERVQLRSHALAESVHAGTRAYFFGDSKVVKRFRLVAPMAAGNQAELAREIAFLTEHGSVLGHPELIESGACAREAWLVRASVRGELLLDAIQSGKTFDPARVIRDVLRELAALEDRGLFHNDLTVWNTILKSDGGVTLIDFGAISATRANCTWPDDLLQAFIQFVRDVVTRETLRALPIRRPFISPFNLPVPYRQWLMGAWTSTSPDWTFAQLLRTFDATIAEVSKAPVRESAIGLWMGSMEQHIDTLGQSLPGFAAQITEITRTTDAAKSHQAAAMTHISQQLAGVEQQLLEALARVTAAQLADRQHTMETLLREHAAREDTLRLRLETDIRELESQLDRSRQLHVARETELTRKLEEQIAALETARQQHTLETSELKVRLMAAAAEVAHERLRADSLLASTSWKITTPLRKVRTAAMIVRKDPSKFLPLVWRVLATPFRHRKMMTSQVSGSRTDATSLRLGLPTSTLGTSANANDAQGESGQARMSLPPRARVVFDDLTNAIAKHQ